MTETIFWAQMNNAAEEFFKYLKSKVDGLQGQQRIDDSYIIELDDGECVSIKRLKDIYKSFMDKDLQYEKKDNSTKEIVKAFKELEKTITKGENEIQSKQRVERVQKSSKRKTKDRPTDKKSSNKDGKLSS